MPLVQSRYPIAAVLVSRDIPEAERGGGGSEDAPQQASLNEI